MGSGLSCVDPDKPASPTSPNAALEQRLPRSTRAAMEAERLAQRIAAPVVAQTRLVMPPLPQPPQPSPAAVCVNPLGSGSSSAFRVPTMHPASRHASDVAGTPPSSLESRRARRVSGASDSTNDSRSFGHADSSGALVTLTDEERMLRDEQRKARRAWAAVYAAQVRVEQEAYQRALLRAREMQQQRRGGSIRSCNDGNDRSEGGSDAQQRFGEPSLFGQQDLPYFEPLPPAPLPADFGDAEFEGEVM